MIGHLSFLGMILVASGTNPSTRHFADFKKQCLSSVSYPFPRVGPDASYTPDETKSLAFMFACLRQEGVPESQDTELVKAVSAMIQTSGLKAICCELRQCVTQLKMVPPSGFAEWFQNMNNKEKKANRCEVLKPVVTTQRFLPEVIEYKFKSKECAQVIEDQDLYSEMKQCFKKAGLASSFDGKAIMKDHLREAHCCNAKVCKRGQKMKFPKDTNWVINGLDTKNSAYVCNIDDQP